MPARAEGPEMELFAACAPGLEPLLAAEVAALGLPALVVAGGVESRGGWCALVHLNLWLRTATRVLVRLGALRATTFAQLVHEATALPFERVLGPSSSVAVRATCRRSRLYHSDAVVERLHAAAQARLGRPLACAAPDGEGEGGGKAGAQLLVARFDRDVCTVSADASGAPLHRRGYRASIGRAPLRETLAAALLLAAGYDGAGEFVDPLCGSGTLALEAALIARRRAPGLSRVFAFQGWPGYDAAAFARAVAEARAGELPQAPAFIGGSDADAVEITAARDNLRRAGLEEDVQLEQRALEQLAPRGGSGLCGTNPPYGVRVGSADGTLDHLWRELGIRVRERLPGFAVAVLSPDSRLAKAARLPFRTLLRTQNGGLPVEILAAPAARS